MYTFYEHNRLHLQILHMFVAQYMSMHVTNTNFCTYKLHVNYVNAMLKVYTPHNKTLKITVQITHKLKSLASTSGHINNYADYVNS